MGICVLSFSSREDGNCARIGEMIASLLPDAKLYRFSDFSIRPCGHCRYECFEEGDRCPWIGDKEAELLDAITGSELTYFIMPNYCDYPCANFFIFNERSLCYFQKNEARLEAYERVRKKAVVVSNSGREHFEAALRYHVSGEPEILFLSPKEYGKNSIRGDLLTSEGAVRALTRFVLET